MIYADFNGSSLLYTEVKEYLIDRLQNGPFGNPNAIHSIGQKLNTGIENSRKFIANSLGADPSQIIFNSGASEGISQVFHHLAAKRKDKKKIIISAIEHAAIRNAALYYQQFGFEMIEAEVDQNGVLDLEKFKELMHNSDDIAFVSIMAANNETGVIQPYQEIGKICQDLKVPFFSDTTQYIGKIDFNFSNSYMDFAVSSSHKIGALIGSGFIMVKDPADFDQLVFGGGQEFGLRGGTQNYIAIETMAVALNAFDQQKENLAQVQNARLEFEDQVIKSFPKTIVIGKEAKRLAGTCLLSYPGHKGQIIQRELEKSDIFVTTSSACSDKTPEASRVLKAMGISNETGQGVIRISLCCNANQETFSKIFKALKDIYEKLDNV